MPGRCSDALFSLPKIFSSEEEIDFYKIKHENIW